MPVRKFEQLDVFEELFELPTFFTKRMFSGLALYYQGKLIIVLAEDEKTTSWQKKTANFPIWNGILLVTSREFHESLIADFPQLIQHPILGKWLYLTREHDDFDFEKLIKFIKRQDLRLGVFPKIRQRKPTLKKKKNRKKS